MCSQRLGRIIHEVLEPIWRRLRRSCGEEISSLANNIGIPWMTSKGDGLQFPGRVNHGIA